MYSQVERIRSSIKKTKVAKQQKAKDEDQNVENEINTKNEYLNDTDSVLVKYKDKTQPIESTEDTNEEERHGWR